MAGTACAAGIGAAASSFLQRCDTYGGRRHRVRTTARAHMAQPPPPSALRGPVGAPAPASRRITPTVIGATASSNSGDSSSALTETSRGNNNLPVVAATTTTTTTTLPSKEITAVAAAQYGDIFSEEFIAALCHDIVVDVFDEHAPVYRMQRAAPGYAKYTADYLSAVAEAIERLQQAGQRFRRRPQQNAAWRAAVQRQVRVVAHPGVLPGDADEPSGDDVSWMLTAYDALVAEIDDAVAARERGFYRGAYASLQARLLCQIEDGRKPECLRAAAAATAALPLLRRLPPPPSQTSVPYTFGGRRYVVDCSGAGMSGVWPDLMHACVRSKRRNADAAQRREIEAVNLSSNRLRYLHDDVFGSRRAQAALRFVLDVDLSNNALSHVPAGLHTLQTLQALDLSDNRLSDNRLPTSVGVVARVPLAHALQALFLSGNRLKALPAALDAPQLEMLYVDRNQLTGVVDVSGWRAPQLRELELSDNWLTALAPGVAALPRLRRLGLLRNPQLAALPSAELDGMSQLVELRYDVQNVVAAAAVPHRLTYAVREYNAYYSGAATAAASGVPEEGAQTDGGMYQVTADMLFAASMRDDGDGGGGGGGIPELETFHAFGFGGGDGNGANDENQPQLGDWLRGPFFA